MLWGVQSGFKEVALGDAVGWRILLCYGFDLRGLFQPKLWFCGICDPGRILGWFGEEAPAVLAGCRGEFMALLSLIKLLCASPTWLLSQL